MKLFLDSVGCRLNQSEIEAYASQFQAAGHVIVSRPGDADLVVINTCAVTAEAASDSRQKIRQAFKAGAGQVTVTGCWSTLNPQEALALPGVTRVIDNPDKDRLVSRVLNTPLEEFEVEPVSRQPAPGARLRTRAFIKAQDGCDNHCTFCVTTIARGEARSRPIAGVLQDIRSAVESGAQEIVLTGVHLGSWGYELGEGLHLKDLVQAILDQVDLPRLRLSSLEPWDLDTAFFELWQDPRLCRQLHLPLQSGCEQTLRRMARKTRPGAFAELVAGARAQVPGVAVTTDVIVGFPGESPEEFQESLDFVNRMAFAGGHVFSYSARPGTAAARFPGRINGREIRDRSRRMRETIAISAQAYREAHLGQTLPVLWEAARGVGPQGWEMSGLTENYLRVHVQAPRDMWNQITPVKLTGLVEDGLRGELPEE